MSDIKKAIETRKVLKSRKPTFKRQDSHKKPCLGVKHRRPRGLQSKMRLRKRGYSKTPKIGYGSPKQVYGMLLEGLKPVDVSNLSDLSLVDPKTECAVISASLGNKKRMDLYKEAIAKKITIANVSSPDEYLKDLESKYTDRKKSKKAKIDERSSKKAKAAKETKKKDSKKESESVDDAAEKAEEHKKKEKEEKDKILLKKQ